MQKFPMNWSLEEKINYLQRKVILNSIAYYRFDLYYRLTDEDRKYLLKIDQGGLGR